MQVEQFQQTMQNQIAAMDHQTNKMEKMIKKLMKSRKQRFKILDLTVVVVATAAAAAVEAKPVAVIKFLCEAKAVGAVSGGALIKEV